MYSACLAGQVKGRSDINVRIMIVTKYIVIGCREDKQRQPNCTVEAQGFQTQSHLSAYTDLDIHCVCVCAYRTDNFFTYVCSYS